jgi:hypothetical protein
MPNNTPALYVYFRLQSTALPATILPANCNPSKMGIQVSSIQTWIMQGTPTMEFAVIGTGPQASPLTAATVANPSNVWSLQGAEVRAYLDYRVTATAFSPAGTTDCPLIFCGDIHEIRPVETSDNPWYAFACSARGLISRAERVPVTSPIDNGDTIRFNMNAMLAEYQPTTGGKSVGDAIKMVLENYAVAYRLNSSGIGGYTLDTANQTSSLPASTINDLASITIITPFEFRIGGDNVMAAIQQIMDSCCPNYGLVILPSGIIRFYDTRVYRSASLDLMTQPIDGFKYTKSTLGSYSRVLVRGGPKVVPYYCQWSVPRLNPSYNLDDSPDLTKFNGSLVESFESAGITNTQAKQAYQHSDFTWGRTLLSTGNVSFSLGNISLPSNKVRVTPDTGNIAGRTTPNMKTWNTNELIMIDGTTENRRECRIVVRRKLTKTGSPNIDVRVDSGEFLITANDELLSGSTECNLTTAPNVDRPPVNPAGYFYTSTYEIYGYTIKGSVTWRKYKVQLDPIAANTPLTNTQKGMRRALGSIFPTGADGLSFSQLGANSTAYDAGRMRKAWYPECLVEYRQRIGTAWGYNSFWTSFRIDPTNNIIVLNRPSVTDANNNGITGNYTIKTPDWDTAAANATTDQPFQIIPYNIKALLPVYEGTQEAVYPHYDANGTIVAGETESKIKSIYGISRDLIVSIPDWYDNRDQSYADQYAKELWGSVQMPQIEGGFGWVYGIPDPTPTANIPLEWDYRGLIDSTESALPVRRVQAFTITANETCKATTGSGIEDCPLLLSSCQIQFQQNRKPFTIAGFTTAKPRVGVPMRDFHSFEDHLARDPISF